MRWLSGLVVAAVVVVGLPAAPADVSGAWRAEVPGPGGSKASEALELTVKDGAVTGTFTNALGGVAQVKEGKWDGTVLRFWVPWSPGKLVATGTLVGATLQLDETTSQWTARHSFIRSSAGKASRLPASVR